MIRLDIKWQGSVPGIAEHRLSVQHFGKPLRNLLMAIRRTANNMLRQAFDRKESQMGRVASEADQIDLQIAEVFESSLGVGSIVDVQIPHGPQMLLMPEQLAEDAIDRLLSDLEKESKGIRRNTVVRKYLESLPPGLSFQEYTLYVNGEERRKVTLDQISVPLPIESLPFLFEVSGNVIGVGFQPGRHFVRIKSTDANGSEITFHATPQQVATALENRSAPVRVMALVSTSGRRLLRIQPAVDQRVRLDRDSYVFGKWALALAELAK